MEKGVWGAVIGDIIGSRFEFRPIKTKTFELFHPDCRFTDDTVMTVAIREAGRVYLETGEDRSYQTACVEKMREFGRHYPNAGYGGRFERWIFSERPEPYNSFGNGSGMRASSVAYLEDHLEQVARLAEIQAAVTHDHFQGILGSIAVTGAVFLARSGASKEEIAHMLKTVGYDTETALAEIRPTYRFDVTCQGSVPQAMRCFLEAESLEDAIRNAVSLGGDSDTMAAMAGAVAAEFFGVPDRMRMAAEKYLTQELKDCLNKPLRTER